MRKTTPTNRANDGTASRPAASRTPPIRWWRSMHADALRETETAAMCAALAKIELCGEPRWRPAMTGDVAAAIGMVMSMTPRHCGHLRFDLAATALAICAVNGSAAACLVMANVLRRMPGSGPAEARLATSWLTVAFRPVLDRNLGSLSDGETS